MSNDFDPARVFAVRDVGARARQEDYHAIARIDAGAAPLGAPDLLIVADGMGGHAGGDEASRIAVDAFHEAVKLRLERSPESRLEDGLAAANQAVGDAARGRADRAGMGCTLLGVELRAGVARWISVGDSPFWLLRGSDLIRLNDDHSMAGLYKELVERGELTAAEAESRGGGNQLRSAIMGERLELIDRKGLVEGVTLMPGDRLILASDGILTLSERDIVQAARSGDGSAKASAEALVAKVKAARRKNQDNTTVVVYRHPGEETATVVMSKDAENASSLGGNTIVLLSLLVVVAALGLIAWVQLAPGGPAQGQGAAGSADSRGAPAPTTNAPSPEGGDRTGGQTGSGNSIR